MIKLLGFVFLCSTFRVEADQITVEQLPQTFKNEVIQILGTHCICIFWTTVLKCKQYYITNVRSVTWSDNITVGQLPQPLQDELIQILLGTLVVTDQCPPPEENEIKFLLYKPNNPNNPTTLNVSKPTGIDSTKPVKFLIHGWLSSPDTAGFQELRYAYLQRYKNDQNLIVLDWSKIAGELYSTAYCRLPSIAQQVATFLCLLQEALNFDLTNVHLVGHSLGAQMSGFIGQNTVAQCGKSVGRITGMDPAAPGYEGLSVSERLDNTDAGFVDVQHTNGGELGYYGPCGHVDFYVNCGSKQPNCPQLNLNNTYGSILLLVACSHIRVVFLMAESVNSNNFIATSCEGCPCVCLRDVWFPSKIIMGENCARNPPKNSYWTPTNGSPPYAKG